MRWLTSLTLSGSLLVARAGTFLMQIIHSTHTFGRDWKKPPTREPSGERRAGWPRSSVQEYYQEWVGRKSGDTPRSSGRSGMDVTSLVQIAYKCSWKQGRSIFSSSSGGRIQLLQRGAPSSKWKLDIGMIGTPFARSKGLISEFSIGTLREHPDLST